MDWRRWPAALRGRDLCVIELHGTLQFTMDYGEYVFTPEGKEGNNAYWARRSFGQFRKGGIQKTGEIRFQRGKGGWQVVADLQPEPLPSISETIRDWSDGPSHRPITILFPGGRS